MVNAMFFIIVLTTLDSYCKNCIRDRSGCPLAWISIGNYCVSARGDRMSKLSSLSISSERNGTSFDSDQNWFIGGIDGKSVPVWPCNDGEAILSEMLEIETKFWNGLTHSGPVNPHNGNITSFAI